MEKELFLDVVNRMREYLGQIQRQVDNLLEATNAWYWMTEEHWENSGGGLGYCIMVSLDEVTLA